MPLTGERRSFLSSIYQRAVDDSGINSGKHTWFPPEWGHQKDRVFDFPDSPDEPRMQGNREEGVQVSTGPGLGQGISLSGNKIAQ